MDNLVPTTHPPSLKADVDKAMMKLRREFLAEMDKLWVRGQKRMSVFANQQEARLRREFPDMPPDLAKRLIYSMHTGSLKELTEENDVVLKAMAEGRTRRYDA